MQAGDKNLAQKITHYFYLKTMGCGLRKKP